VLRIALPAALGLMSYAAMQALDCALLGHYNTTDQAGAGLTFILVWALMSPVLGTMSGIATFSAQYKGTGRYKRAGRHLRSVVLVAAVASLPYLLFAYLGPDLVQIVFNAKPAVEHAAGQYLRIRLFGAVFFCISMGTSSFFRGTGDAVTPLKVSIFANIINLILDYLLIFGHAGFPEMGVRGAALATILAQAFEAAAFIYLMFSNGKLRREFGMGFRGKIHWVEVRRLIRVGGPIGAFWFFEAMAWAVFMRTLGSFDEAVTAASYAAFQIMHLSFLPVVGLLQAAQSLVGQYFGSGDPAAGRRRGFLCMRMGVAFMSLMGVLMLIFRGTLISLFNPDPEVVRVGSQVLVWVAVAQPFDAMAMTALGALRGAGDTVFAFWVLVVVAWVVFVPLTYLIAFPLGGGPAAAWIGALVFLMILAGVTVVRLRGRNWEKKRV